jgi:hypothetical protein
MQLILIDCRAKKTRTRRQNEARKVGEIEIKELDHEYKGSCNNALRSTVFFFNAFLFSED